MYANRNEVNDLIKSLSSNEKRYFSKFSKAFAPSERRALYLRLYDAIEQGQTQVSKVLDGESKRAVETAKTALHGNILKALRLQYEDSSVDSSVLRLLTDVEILYRRGLSVQGIRLIGKAYDQVKAAEKFGLLLQVLDWEKRLNIVLDTPSRPIEQIIAEERQTLRQLHQAMDLENIYTRIMLLKRQYGYVRAAARTSLEKQTVKAPDMPTLAGCLSSKAVFYYHFIHAIYCWMTFQHEQAYGYSKLLLNPGRIAIPPTDYIAGLLQHITSCVCLGYFKQTLTAIKASEDYVKSYGLGQSRAFTSLMFAYHATYELIVLGYIGKPSRIKAAIKRVERGLATHGPLLSQELMQIIRGNLMNAYMASGDLRTADQIWDTMFNRQSAAIRQDIYADLYLFRLFSLLHGKNYVLLASAAQAALRYFNNQKDNEGFELEIAIASLLRKQLAYQKSTVFKELMNQIQSKVRTLVHKRAGVIGFQEHYTRYEIWAEAITNDEPYHVAAANWYKSFRTKVKAD